MTEKIAVLLIFAGVLACCEEKQESGSKPRSEPNARTNRSERHSGEASGTRVKTRTALDSAKAIKLGDEREKAIAKVAWDSIESAPDIALQAIAELPAGNLEREGLIQSYAQQLAKENPDAALAWGNSLSDSNETTLVREQVALTLKDLDPKRALGLFPNFGFSAGGMDSSAEQVLQNWTSQNPADASVWVSGIASTDARKQGFDKVFSHWIQTDAEGALKWASSQGNMLPHQESVRSIATFIGGEPDFLREIFLEHADPKLRAEIEAKIADTVREKALSEPEIETVPEARSEPAQDVIPEPEAESGQAN